MSRYDAQRDEREVCQRCGYPVPSRLRGTGWCTVRCRNDQAREDQDSIDAEIAEAEK